MTRSHLQRIFAGRGFVLLPAAAFAVHQLRYTLAYGSRADQVMAAQGHSYLDSLAPWLVLLLALGAGTYLARVSRSLAGRTAERPRRTFFGVWALASVALLAIYVVQEFLEGLYAVGHPAGMAGIVGHGGWWVVAIAPFVGAFVAALLRLAAAIDGAARRLVTKTLAWPEPGDPRRPRAIVRSRRSPLAGSAAGRAPPAAASAAALAC
jgi:hypothetical protein